MGEMVRKTGDAVLIDKYAQKTSMKLSTFMQLPVSADAVRAEFKKATPSRTPRPMESDSDMDDAAENQPMPGDREMWLLRFILSGDDHIDWLAQHLNLEWIQHSTVRNIIAARLRAHADNSWHGVASFVSSQDEPFAQTLITEAVATEVAAADLARNLSEALRLLRNQHIDRRLSSLTVRLGQPALSDNDVVTIEKEKTYLRRWKTEPLQPKADS
jgi:hypothetical protein